MRTLTVNTATRCEQRVDMRAVYRPIDDLLIIELGERRSNRVMHFRGIFDNAAKAPPAMLSAGQRDIVDRVPELRAIVQQVGALPEPFRLAIAACLEVVEFRGYRYDLALDALAQVRAMPVVPRAIRKMLADTDQLLVKDGAVIRGLTKLVEHLLPGPSDAKRGTPVSRIPFV